MRAFNSRAGLLRLPGKEKRGTFPMKMKWYDRLLAALCALVLLAAAVFAVGDALTGSHGTASLNARPRLVLAGLDPAAQYRDEENNTYTGAQLLTTGLELPGGYGQMPAKIWYLKKV